ncbi:MAG TPA: threonine synthase, partial [Nitrolancea sp.]|nr:threonine synthase [Nitrolancea sp.]
MKGVVLVFLRCIECGDHYPTNKMLTRCACGGLLDLELELNGPVELETFDRRLQALTGPDRSGVWRYRELLPPVPEESIVTKPEGNTNLYDVQNLTQWAGVD